MKSEQSLKIEVNGEDVDKLKSVVKKLSKEICKVGLQNNTITKEEHETFIKLNDSLNK